MAIIGLGYVGLPLAVEFGKAGFHVIGIDVNAEKVKQISKGKSYIQDVPTDEVRELVKSGHLKASTNFERLKRADAIIVCVPTPLNRVKEPDISYIMEASQQIAKYLKRGQLIVLESTTYPGTTDEVILPMLQKKNFRAGREFYLCFSPERIDPGNKKFPVATIPKVVGGITANCTKAGALLYGQIFFTVVPVSSSRTAEMAKLLENTFRIVNIGLMNELATVAGALHVDIWEAIDAAKTKPFGYMPFYPGPGVGGHCIGIDPIYLSWKAKAHGADIRFIELAREVNTNMPHYVVERALKQLSLQKKAIHEASILILGITYKKDIDDTRESPSFEVLERLNELGAQISYHDPFVPSFKLNQHLFKSRPLTKKEIQKHDLVLILTDHTAFDYVQIFKDARLILDTRNAMKQFKSKKIIKL